MPPPQHFKKRPAAYEEIKIDLDNDALKLAQYFEMFTTLITNFILDGS